MSLKAVLFDFNGVIIKDASIQMKLIDEILVQENLQPLRRQERQTYLGRSDRTCWTELLKFRGRVVSEKYLAEIFQRKAQAYSLELEQLETIPIYPGVEDLIFQLRSVSPSHQIKLGIVSDVTSKEVELVLERTKLASYFSVIVTADDLTTSKPAPDGYLLAVKRLNEQYPDLNLQPEECLAIEDTPTGIKAAKRANMQVLGVANTYPYHFIQRQANWAVDYLNELELERVEEIFAQKNVQSTASEC
ncbi:MAG TPA: HAD family phosphatase [Nostocaceae cyanobacterium]|nr:HAD family phosphatase [Nostocaceae cyanobacterium]